jgi:hypothetical protein
MAKVYGHKPLISLRFFSANFFGNTVRVSFGAGARVSGQVDAQSYPQTL